MPFFPVDDGFSSHPKVVRLRRGVTRERAAGLWTLAGSWCARNLTDGQVPPGQVEELGCTKAAAAWLVNVRLWHDRGHDCAACPQPEPGGYVFHQWSEEGRNWTREQVREHRAKKADAGRKGGQKSGETRRRNRSNDEAPATAPASRDDAPGNAEQRRPVIPANAEHRRPDTPAILQRGRKTGHDRESSQVSDSDVEAPASSWLNPPSPTPSPPLQTPNPLVALVCRRLAGDARRATTTDEERAELWAMWADVAGPGVDLDAELRLWLLRNAETDLRDPAGALIGWLRKAAERAAKTGPLGCARCTSGWLEDDTDGRPVPCPTCRPHLRVAS